MDEKTVPQSSHLSLTHTKGYRAWFIADTSISVGMTLRGFAIPLIAYSLSGNLALAGWVTSAAAISQQIMAIFGGTFIDRHNRRRLVLVNCAAGTVIWGTVFILLFLRKLTLPFLMFAAVVYALINGLLGHASDALLRSLISIYDYAKARSINEGRDATVTMAASPLGGMLYAIAAWVPFLVSAVVYGIGAAAALFIPRAVHPQAHITANEGRTGGSSFFTDFIDGWKWSFNKRVLIIVMITASLVNLGINGIQYVIQLHLISSGVDSVHIGFVDAGICLGMVIGSVVSAQYGNRMPVGITICSAYIVMCLAAAPMILSDNYILILICNTLTGLSFPLINSLMLGFVFAKTPDNMQGRVTTALSMPASALSAFSSAAAGILVSSAGFGTSIAIFISAIALCAFLTLISKRIRRIPASAEWGSYPL